MPESTSRITPPPASHERIYGYTLGSLFSGVFSKHGFAPLWASGVCWHWARWGIAFVSAYYVNELTDSPRLVQLTGAVMWAPLLLVGALGGVIADRFDRLRTVQIQLAVMVPLVLLIGLAERSDQLTLWMLYPFLLLAGTGWVGDMTSRRALVLDIVGPRSLHKAMALETISLASGAAVGNLMGGTVTDAIGVGGAYYVIAGLLFLALLFLQGVPTEAKILAEHANDAPEVIDPAAPSVLPPEAEPGARQTTWHDLREGLRLVHTNHTLRSILGITVLANAFYFSYFPAVQRVGDRLDATPTQIGIIASMTGFGMITGSIITSRFIHRRWGRAYVFGAIAAMMLLVPFGTAPNVPLAVFFLFASSCAIGLFAATQSTLVLTAVPLSKSGRAMGLLSMSIGALPLGAFILGEVAQQIGASMALVSMPSVGLIAIVLWLIPSREVLSCEAPDGQLPDLPDPEVSDQAATKPAAAATTEPAAAKPDPINQAQ